MKERLLENINELAEVAEKGEYPLTFRYQQNFWGRSLLQVLWGGYLIDCNWITKYFTGYTLKS